MKILVTGSDGQLGNELHEILEQRMPGITDYVDRQELDITDRAAVDNFISSGNYSHIINCAAYTAVDRAEDEKIQCTAVNVDGVRNLAGAATANGCRMLHISTDYVFDGNTNRPYNESDKPSPASHYGTTKRTSETVLMGLAPDAIIIRTGWLYSSYGNNFVKTMLRLANSEHRLNVVADQTGTPTYAADLALMIADIIQAPQWIAGIYHFSNEGVASWYDFACAVVDAAGLSDSVTVNPIHTADYPTAAIRPFYSVLEKSKIKATYGVTIPNWRSSLVRCMQRISR